MRIKEGSSRPGDAQRHLLWLTLKPSPQFLTVPFVLVWSDDDWLKRFSGKTLEEAEAEAGETTKTTAPEVRQISLLYIFLTIGV